MMRWGSTRVEREEPLPGDSVIPEATISVTRAIDVAAPSPAVWPWLVQLGYGPDRAGFYSYDALENLMGLSIHSAARVIPELQGLRAGDRVPLGPDTGFLVQAADAPEALVLEARMHPFNGRDVEPDAAPALHWTWAFILRERPFGTRLLIRTRGRWQPPRLGPLVEPFLEPVWFVMERRMLLGIRERAERLAVEESERRASA
jgi:hypothetical protein